MAEKFSFFDPVQTPDGLFDREYNAQEFTDYFSTLVTTGVMKGAGNQLSVSADGASMQTKLNTGVAFVEGRYYANDSVLTHTHDTEVVGKDRIDRIVIRLDLSTEARYVKSFVKKGVASTSPVAPSLTQTPNLYEISVAQVKVIGGQTFISVSNVIDERGKDVICPWAGSKILPNFNNDAMAEHVDNKLLHKQSVNCKQNGTNSNVFGKGNATGTPNSIAIGVFSLASCGKIQSISKVNNELKQLDIESTAGLKVGDLISVWQFYGEAYSGLKIIKISGTTITLDTNLEMNGNWVYAIIEQNDEKGTSFAGGYNTFATGSCSHAEGWLSRATGAYSTSFGEQTRATGDLSFVSGLGGRASVYASTAIGSMPKELNGGNATSFSATSDAFVIGNGYPDRSNAFRVTFAGKVYGVGAFNSTGADYAEYFEWADGNSELEERQGYFVTLENNKIRKATSSDDYILGVVSVNPSVIGDSHQDDWNDKYLTDEWGRIQYHYVDVPEEKDSEGRVIQKARQDYVPILNPNWNHDEEYIPREQRPEWSPVGIVGKLLVRDDGTCEVNGYCKSNDEGIATSSTVGYRVMKRVSENIVQVFIK